MNEIYHVDVNKEVFTLEDARAAAELIFSIQQKDFESIVNEKWYRRFLGALTLHSGDKKKVIRSISSLSKLQTLFMKVYSEQYRGLDQELNEIIDNLSKVNATVKRLYDACVLQIRPQENLKNLTYDDKQILMLLLTQYQSISERENTLKTYRLAVANAAEGTLPEGKFDNKQLLKVNTPKVFYRCLLEMCALDDGLFSMTMPDNVYDAINYLSISQFEKNNIENTVKDELEFFGAEYLVSKYVGIDHLNAGAVIDDSELCLDDQEKNESTTHDEQSKLEEAICDSLFEKVGFGEKYIETQDYYLYLQMSARPSAHLGAETIQKVCKKTGKSETLLMRSDFPQKNVRSFDKWISDGNNVYAFFTDELGLGSYASAGVYAIDVLSGRIKQANFSVAPYECNTTNGHYFVYTEGSEGLVCIDMISGDAHQLEHGDHNSNDRVCTESALYFTDYNRGHEKQIMEYVFGTKIERPLFQLPEGFGTTAMAHYGDKLFVMYNTRQGEQIYCYDFIENKHQLCAVNIECRKNEILKFEDGWLFTAQEKDFPIQFFSFKDASILTIATDCGYTKYVEEGIIKKKLKPERISNRFTRIGSWVYFEKGKNRTVAKVSIDKPMQFHAVSATFDNGPDDISKIFLELSGKWR